MRQQLSKTILITGGAGFIGSEFVRQMVNSNNKIIVVDKLTYAGDLLRLKDVKSKITFHKTDIAKAKAIDTIIQKSKPTMIVHFAAETHVDKSIIDVNPFIQSNIIGAQNLIASARKHDIKRFIHISTDEVYGDSSDGLFTEDSPLKPNNPYAATKTSAELLVRAAIRTFQFPAIIVRPANNYGPWQFPEKFIPVIILKALNDEKIPVYGQGKQIREWLHVSDCARGIQTILKKGSIGESYNIGSYFEKENIETAKTVLALLKKSDALIEFVKDRPGHDFRYSVDCTKLHKLGWKAEVTFNDGIHQTVKWYLANVAWTKQKRQFLKKYWQKVYQKQ